MTSVPPLTITRDVNLMVATPLGGGAQIAYLNALFGLAEAARQEGYGFACAWIEADGSPDRARNALVGAFLASRCTHLMFADGDVGFAPVDVLGLVDLMLEDERYAIMAAATPQRQINWPLVAMAGAQGLGAEDAARLAGYSGQFALDLAAPDAGVKLDQPVELGRASAALMLLRRDVLETLCAAHGDLRYAAEPQDRLAGNMADWLYALFQSTVDSATGQLLPGDALFSYRARSAGFRIWLAPWLRTSVTGPMRFSGSLADLADMDAAHPH